MSNPPRLTEQQLATGFVAALGLIGLLTGLLVLKVPTLADSVVSPFWWPLFAALAFDLLSRPMIHAGRLPELPMQARLAGVVVGALAYQVIRWTFPLA